LSEPRRMRVFNVVSPVVFFGGLVAALVLNSYAVMRLRVAREGSEVVGTVRVELRLWNVAVLVASSLLLCTLAGYVFAENLTQV
jgi:hypothetical protein